MDPFKIQLLSIGAQFGFNSCEVQSVLNTFDPNRITYILNTYGNDMLGILIVMAENQLEVDFAKEPTVADGNCFMAALRNQTVENMALNLSDEHIRELNMDIQHLRKLWCQTGKGYFAGKWGSKENWKGNMSDAEWNADWDKQAVNGVYDGTNMASDMFVMVAAHRLKRHILVIDSDQKCVRFLDGNIFIENNVTDLNPFILAHTINHYQSMVPHSESDSFWRQFVFDQANINRMSNVLSVADGSKNSTESLDKNDDCLTAKTISKVISSNDEPLQNTRPTLLLNSQNHGSLKDLKTFTEIDFSENTDEPIGNMKDVLSQTMHHVGYIFYQNGSF